MHTSPQSTLLPRTAVLLFVAMTMVSIVPAMASAAEVMSPDLIPASSSGQQAEPWTESRKGFADLAQPENVGSQTQFLVNAPTSKASAKVTPVVASGQSQSGVTAGPPWGLISGLTLLAILGVTMWYVARRRAL